MPYFKLLPILTLAIGFACVVTACVRLDEPSAFICKSDSDCDSDQKCESYGTTCVAKDFCQESYECGNRQRCDNQHCVQAECTVDTAASDCDGYPCYDGICESSCTLSDECADGFRCSSSKCVAGAPFADGQKCQTNGDCSSAVCCAKPSGSVCTASCSTPPTDSCSSGLDCASAICCARADGTHTCSAMACAALPECTTNADCPFDELCQSQKCVTPPPLKAVGAACTTAAECASGSCFGGECRGTASTGQTCTMDVDCTSDRVCCQGLYSSTKSCSQAGMGCPGTIGSACMTDSDCFGNNCNNGYFCTQACTTNADCGTSPWGVANACETNGLGDKTCFPGCTTTQQCSDNLGADLQCYPALDSSAQICASG